MYFLGPRFWDLEKYYHYFKVRMSSKYHFNFQITMNFVFLVCNYICRNEVIITNNHLHGRIKLINLQNTKKKYSLNCLNYMKSLIINYRLARPRAV